MIGCDVADIKRFEKVLKSATAKRFLTRIFSENEFFELFGFCLAEFGKKKLKAESLAGYFAAKEAASKALGCGICKDCTFVDICIKKDEKGRPSVIFSEKIAQNFGVKSAFLSISHDAGVAFSVVQLAK